MGVPRASRAVGGVQKNKSEIFWREDFLEGRSSESMCVCHRSFSAKKARDPSSRRRAPALRSSTYSLLTHLPCARTSQQSRAAKLTLNKLDLRFQFFIVPFPLLKLFLQKWNLCISVINDCLLLSYISKASHILNEFAFERKRKG